jgi:CubicO group peptidase (beta-lactamase class C family)
VNGALVPDNENAQRLSKAPVFPSAAGGLVSTVDDYLKFARMLLNGGSVDGVRILSRKSIELMTQDHMSAAQREMFWALPGWWDEGGFGFGFYIREKQPRLGPSPGSFNWNGSSGVSWIVDPKEDLIYLRFLQRRGILPGGSFDQDFETAVYQSIVD